MDQESRTVRINIPLFLWQEGTQIVAHTPALELATCGDTREQALANFQEAVSLFFEVTADRDSLDDVLTDLGWEKREDNWIPNMIPLEGDRSFPVDVPLSVQ